VLKRRDYLAPTHFRQYVHEGGVQSLSYHIEENVLTQEELIQLDDKLSSTLPRQKFVEKDPNGSKTAMNFKSWTFEDADLVDIDNKIVRKIMDANDIYFHSNIDSMDFTRYNSYEKTQGIDWHVDDAMITYRVDGQEMPRSLIHRKLSASFFVSSPN